ncbi:MAG: D-glycero-beta-D-manno-heptose 1-phosphate adenylyltransferase [Desulfovibrio sp.]|nr:D-glycero-beta-D-manno-heptose 1-phosphate adenylyltransferase [Desulfovibrio sp.]
MLDFSKAVVFVAGDAMLDRYVAATVSRLSPEAPVPVARVDREWGVPGGAANVAAGLAALGCRAVLFACRGADTEGRELERLLEERGVECVFAEAGSRSTTTKTRIVSRGQQLVRLDREERGPAPAEAVERLAQVFEARIGEMVCVVLSDYDKGLLRSADAAGEALAQRIIRRCRESGVPVLADPKTRDWSVFQGASCITPNVAELVQAQNLADDGFDALEAGARNAMQLLGLPRLLLTRSEKGVALFEQGVEEPVLFHGRTREVADVSGAGDTVCAVLAAAVAVGMDWPRGAWLANAAGGVAVEKQGTSTVTLAELEDAAAREERSAGLAGIERKICSPERLASLVASWRSSGDRIVFTNGCFDLLHIGHVHVISEAARQGDRLIVAVNSDSSVKKLKGPQRPVQREEARAAVVAALDGVDAVVIFAEDTPRDLIEALKPDVLVKGGDYTVETVVGASSVLARGGRVYLVPTLEGYSTTGIISSIIS